MTSPVRPQDAADTPTAPPTVPQANPAAAGSLVRDPTIYDGMSPTEYQEEVRRNLLRDRQAAEDVPDQESGNPLEVAWQHLKYRVPRLPEAVVQGAANAVKEGAKLATYLAPTPDAGESLRQAATKYGVPEAWDAAVTRAAGAPVTDPVLQLSKGISQFAAGFELTGPLGAASDASWLMKLGSASLRGAVTEASFFDPKEASLMNTLAQTNIPGLQELGKALSIHPDDPQILQRFKHAANGGILTAAGEAALLSGARLLGYAKQLSRLKANGATEEEMAPVIAKATAEQKVVTDVGKGTYAAPDATIKVTPQPDGSGIVEPHRPASNPADQSLATSPEPNGRPSMNSHATADAAEAIAAKAGVTVKMSRNGGDVLTLDRIETPAGEQNKGVMAQVLKEIHDVADQNGTTIRTNVSPDMPEGMTQEEWLVKQAKLRDYMRKNGGYEQTAYGKSEMVREPNTPENTFREQPGTVRPDEQVPVPNAAQAEPQVNSINEAVSAQKAAEAPLSDEVVAEYKTMAQRFGLASSDEDMARLIHTTRFNNVNYASEPTQVLAHAAALESAFKAEFAKSPQTWAETAARARKFLPTSGEPLDPALVRDLAPQDLAAKTLAMDAIRFQQASDITKLSTMMDGDPMNTVLKDNMRTALDNFMETSRIVAGHNSELGRALNILKNRGALRDAMAASRETVEAVSSIKRDVAKVKSLLDRQMENPTVGNEAPMGALTTSDFSLARARAEAQKVYDRIKALKDVPDKHGAMTEEAGNIHLDNASLKGEKIKEAADAQRADPLSAEGLPDPKTLELNNKEVNPVEELSKWMEKADAELDRRVKPKPAKQLGPKESDPVTLYREFPPERAQAPYTAGMTDEEVAAMGRLVRMTGGDLRDAQGIAEAATQITGTFRERVGQALNEAQGPTAKAGVVAKTSLAVIREFFTNYLLGNPKTQAVIASSGINNMMFDNAARWTAGAVTGNPALRLQGADQMYSLFKEFGDNLATGRIALNEGRSVINPREDNYIIGGVTGKVTRLPTRATSINHDMMAVANYRARIRALSMADGRSAGLTGDALEARTQQDLQASFDKTTGIPIHQDAWDYAMDQTYQSPLRPGSFPRAVQDYLGTTPNARWIVPFWKTGVNIFDKAWQWTPGLNQFNTNARNILSAGGPEASVLRTKVAMAGAVYTGVFASAMAGNVTGDGPKDPEIRRMWLQNNQPNSFRFGKNGNWIDYSRMEPWATTIGSIANWHELTQEWGDKKSDANQNMLYAIPAAIVANLANKTYFSGVTRMSDMITSGDPAKYAEFMRRTATAATPIPLHGTMNAMNTDPYFREVRSMWDAEKASIPGLSSSLDPKFNIFGEPTLKNPSYVQRTFLPLFKNQQNSTSVEDDMVDLNARLKPWAEQYSIPGVNTTLDLTDRKSWAQGAADPKKSPWIRFNELMRSPDDGGENFRDQLTNLVHSDEWNDLAGRTPGFSGSAREDRVKLLMADANHKAWKTVLEEYPALDDSIRVLQRMAAGAKRAGPQGVADAQQ